MIKAFQDYSILAHNTFHIDARIKHFIEYDTLEDLRSLLLHKQLEYPILHIGQGSNLLFTKDFDGTVLHSRITDLECISIEGDTILVRAGSGIVWDDFVASCVENGWYGTENLSYIPGEVGASAVQNIGAYGVEVADLIDSVEVVDIATGCERVFSAKECCYAYRYSIFKGEWKGKYIVHHVVYRLGRQFRPRLEYGALRAACSETADALTPKTLRERIIAIRKQKLPEPFDLGSAGSFFMNPILDATTFATVLSRYPTISHYVLPDGRVKVSAGWLIEQCGWKGRALGRAAVYDKQALVLVNLGGATAQEIMDLSQRICEDVWQKFGIRLYPEVNWI